MESFYLVTDGTKIGPFDLVSMIKKIKNGKLLPHHELCIDDDPTPVKANDVRLFHEYFVEIEYEADANNKNPMYPKAPIKRTMDRSSDLPSLPELLSSGWAALVEYQRSAIVVALGIAGTLVLGLGLNSIIGAAGSAIFCGAVTAVLIHLLYLDCAVHAQPGAPQDMAALIKQPSLHLMLAACAGLGVVCIGLPVALWSVIGSLSLMLSVIGFMAFSLSLFAPLLWLNAPNTSGPETIMASARLVLNAPKPLLMRAVALQTIVLVSSAFMVFPLVIILPIVAFAWVRLFDRALT